MTRLNQDPEFLSKKLPKVSAALSKRNQKDWQDQEYRLNKIECIKTVWKDPDHRKMMSKVSSETMTRLHQDPEFCKLIAKGHQTPEYKAKMSKIFTDGGKNRAEIHRATMLRQIESGDFGHAQKMLFNRLPELNPSLGKYLQLEKIVYLTEDIVDKYSGSNKNHYRVDIACTVNGQTKLAIEVDGALGHSTDEELHKDKVRDNILLNEFGIKTIRIRNEEVFKDIDKIAKSVIEEIQSVIRA